jgi:hypothetical protein
MTDRAIHSTLEQLRTHLSGPGFEVMSHSTAEQGRARRYGAEVDWSDLDREEDLVDEEPVDEEPVNEEVGWEGEPINNDPVREWDPNLFTRCDSCFEYNPVEDFWNAPCTHNYCNVCLEVLVQNWYTSTCAPACCHEVFPWEDYKPKVNSELAATLDAKREELDSHDRIYCAEKTCSTFIGAADISGDGATGTCSACGKVTCTICKAVSQPDGCEPDASMSNELQQAGQEGWKRCRECRMVVEREDGCPHMK